MLPNSSWRRPTLKVQHHNHDVTYFVLNFTFSPVLIKYFQTEAEKVTHAARHHHGWILLSRANLSLSWTQAAVTTTLFNPSTEASSSAPPHIFTRRGAHLRPHNSQMALRHRPLPNCQNTVTMISRAGLPCVLLPGEGETAQVSKELGISDAHKSPKSIAMSF